MTFLELIDYIPIYPVERTSEEIGRKAKKSLGLVRQVLVGAGVNTWLAEDTREDGTVVYCFPNSLAKNKALNYFTSPHKGRPLRD